MGCFTPRPRPAIPSARASTRLGAELGVRSTRAWQPGSSISLDDPELHLGDDILVPDLGGWRRNRMARLPLEAAFIAMAPDWICEVLSSGTQAFDRADKMNVYAREGVRHAWLVDPLARLLEVWRLEHAEHGERGLWLRAGTWTGDALVRAEPFDAVEIELAALWAE